VKQSCFYLDSKSLRQSGLAFWVQPLVLWYAMPGLIIGRIILAWACWLVPLCSSAWHKCRCGALLTFSIGPAYRCVTTDAGVQAFFFEKRTKKTFIVPNVAFPKRPSQISKSFLVLFFKKEHTSSLSPA